MTAPSEVNWAEALSAIAACLSVGTTAVLSALIYRLSKGDAATLQAREVWLEAQKRCIDAIGDLYRATAKGLDQESDQQRLVGSVREFLSDYYYFHAIPDECAPQFTELLSQMGDVLRWLPAVNLSLPAERVMANYEIEAIHAKTAALQSDLFSLAAAEARAVLGAKEPVQPKLPTRLLRKLSRRQKLQAKSPTPTA